MTDNDFRQDHARAIRIAHRQAVFDAMLSAAGAAEEAPITEPIPVIRDHTRPASWLSD